jgi:isopenicillin-N N-acyltransferase-like protein
MDIRPVELCGTYREQGRQHGEALAPVIAEIISEIVHWENWNVGRAEAALAEAERQLAQWAPWLVEEMQGIAEGAGLPYRDVLAYNGVVEANHAQSFCTTLGWADTPVGAIIGKTNDIGRHHEKYHWPLIRRGGEGPRAVWVTWPGTIWANCLVNESGVALGGSSLNMKDHAPGIPSNCMYRIVMDTCHSVPEALEACHRIPIQVHPQHDLFADTTNTLAGAEVTPVGTNVCQPPGAPAVFITNHFCPGPYQGQDTNEPRHVTNSRRRRANLERLTATLDHTVENMQRVVCDHAAGQDREIMGAVCQHGEDNMWSSTGYVAIPGERTILVAHGQPCGTPWVEVAL